MSLSLFLAALIASTTAASAPIAGWENLQDGAVQIDCALGGEEPWCRATARLDAPPEVLVEILRDFDAYPEIFPRIRSCRELEPGLAHMVLDMPTPFSDRDYVAQFVQTREGDVEIFTWRPGVHPEAPVGEAVRLERSAGEWRLVPDGDGSYVSYTWQAEIGGDIPTWALPRVRIIQGEEVLGWLETEALSRAR